MGIKKSSPIVYNYKLGKEQFMINEAIIRSECNSFTYTRGLEIFKAGYVDGLEIEEEQDFDFVTASVKGSGMNLYQVYAKYDLNNDDIDYVNCECPAYEIYSGICKHCVAVMLGYMHAKKDDGTYGAIISKKR